MVGDGKRWFAAVAVVGFASLCVGAGVMLSAVDAPKAVDLAELRDAVNAASKRGDNVDEVAKALNALEKAIASGLKADAGKAPPELLAVRQAVEAAARKGENVEEIVKQLELVEKKFTGKALTAPKPVPLPPLGDPKPDVRPQPFRNDLLIPRVEFPGLPNGGFGGGVNREALQKAMDLRMKAMELLLQDPNDPKALEAAQEATEMMLKAIGGGRGLIGPDLMLPDGFGRVPDRVRLGVRMEKPGAVVVEQLGLEPGRGIAIVEVLPGTPAEKAGFKTHDIVVQFNGKPVTDVPEDFNRQVTSAKAGVKFDAEVIRKGKKVEIKGIELPEIAPQKPNVRLNPRPVPLPNFKFEPAVPGFGAGGFAPVRPLPALDFDAPGVNGTSVTMSNGNFTIKSNQDGVKYVLQGTTENGALKLTDAVVDDNGKIHKGDSVEKLPEAYRPAVEKLLKGVGSRPTKKRD